MSTTTVNEYIAQVMAEAPPLTEQQRSLLSGLLRPSTNEGGAKRRECKENHQGG